MHGACDWRKEAGDGPQQRRLATAIRADERNDLAVAAIEGHALEHGITRRTGRDPVKAPCDGRCAEPAMHRDGPRRAAVHRRLSVVDPALVHHKPAGVHGAQVLEPVLRDDNRDAVSSEFRERRGQGARTGVVELREGLVEHKHPGAHREHPGEREALPLAAGQASPRRARRGA